MTNSEILLRKMRDALDEAIRIMSADVVEVVRCKDCKYWDNDDDANRCRHESSCIWAKPNTYCSYAERRTE